MTSDNEIPKEFTVREAATFLGISREQIYLLVQQGELNINNYSARWRIRRDSLLAKRKQLKET